MFASLALILSLGASAFAGTRDGGGGVGVRCGGPRGKLQVLDLYESSLYGHPPSTWNQTRAVESTARLFAGHLASRAGLSFDEWTTAYTKVITPILQEKAEFPDLMTGNNDAIAFVPSLPLSDDIGHYYIEPNCELEQIAYFSDDKVTLQIVHDKWAELDWLDKSALVAHELSYLFDRRSAIENFGVDKTYVTSESTRAFVGKLFSIEGLTPLQNALFDKGNFLSCAGPGSNDPTPTSGFNGVDSGPNQLTVDFEVIYGMWSLFEMKAVFDGVNMRTLFRYNEGGAISVSAPLQFTDEIGVHEFTVQINKPAGKTSTFRAFQNQSGKLVPLGPETPIYCEMRGN